MSIRKEDAVDLIHESIHHLNELHDKLNRITSIFNPSVDNKEGQRCIAAVRSVFNDVLNEIQAQPTADASHVTIGMN